MLTLSPLTVAVKWIRSTFAAPSPLILILVGASIPFLGAVLGYAHQEAIADKTAAEANTARSQVAAAAVFEDVSTRLTSVELLRRDLYDANADSAPDSVLIYRTTALMAGLREWELAYPRLHALTKVYFGDEIAKYLAASDRSLRSEEREAPRRTEIDIAVRRTSRSAAIADARADSAEARLTPDMIRRMPDAMRDSLRALRARHSADSAKILDETRQIVSELATVQASVEKTRTLNAELFVLMADEIQDGIVGLSSSDREAAVRRAESQKTILGSFGVYPFDAAQFFWTAGLLLSLTVAASLLARATGRNRWLWAIAAFLFALPALLYLILAPPRRTTQEALTPPFESTG